MPTPLMLAEDLTGLNPNNLIQNEDHVLTSSTGRCWALNYGAFYTESLIITRVSDGHVLVPGIDYMAVAPNDDVSQRSGSDSMSVLVLTKDDDYDDTYRCTYQAVGGAYSTNIQAVRDVIQAVGDSFGTVEWGMILNKPSQFETAPHLIDFRTQLYGFEGLNTALAMLSSAVSGGDPSIIAAMMTTIQGVMTQHQASINQQLSAMQAQITALGQAIPSTSGLLSGTPATDAQVKDASAPAAYMRTTNLTELIRAGAFSGGQVLTQAEIDVIDTTQLPLVSGSLNLSADASGARSTAKADDSVPTSTVWWIIETHYLTRYANYGTGAGFQIARAYNTGSTLRGCTLYRTRNNQQVTTPWTRIDAGAVVGMSMANMTTDLDWNNPNTTRTCAPAHIREFILRNNQNIVPVGSIMIYAARPSGNTFAQLNHTWRYAEGGSLSRADFPELYAVIGGTWGQTTTSFTLPDLRGVVIRGHDARTIANGNRDPDRGDNGDFGSYQADVLKEHMHLVAYVSRGPMLNGKTVDWIQGGRSMNWSTSSSGGSVDARTITASSPPMNMPTATVADSTVAAASAYETRMRNVTMAMMIRIR